MAIFTNSAWKYGWAAGAMALCPHPRCPLTAGSASPSGCRHFGGFRFYQEDFSKIDASPGSTDVAQRFNDAPLRRRPGGHRPRQHRVQAAAAKPRIATMQSAERFQPPAIRTEVYTNPRFSIIASAVGIFRGTPCRGLPGSCRAAPPRR